VVFHFGVLMTVSYFVKIAPYSFSVRFVLFPSFSGVGVCLAGSVRLLCSNDIFLPSFLVVLFLWGIFCLMLFEMPPKSLVRRHSGSNGLRSGAVFCMSIQRSYLLTEEDIKTSFVTSCRRKTY
jgi:hypothetical protein